MPYSKEQNLLVRPANADIQHSQHHVVGLRQARRVDLDDLDRSGARENSQCFHFGLDLPCVHGAFQAVARLMAATR